MMKKLLTLAVPTYNMEKYLARCLDSVLCANKDYLEVLVVNDGSKDRSSEIGHMYEARYPNVIRVIDKENGNYGSCVNRALAEARGKYFRMLDADDWCDTEALNQWLENLKTCDADMVLTIAEDRNENGTLIQTITAPSSVQEGIVYEADEFDGLKLGYNKLFCSHIVTYRTSVLREIKLQLQQGISYTDNEYVFFPLDHIQTVVYFRLPVYQYFIGREGQTTQPEILMRQTGQILQVFDRLFEYYNVHKMKLPKAMLSNQRIVLCEMLNWIYSPLFRSPKTEERKACLIRIEQTVKKDDFVYAEVGDRNAKLAFFRKTGIFSDSLPAKLQWQIYRLTNAICRRILHNSANY